MGPDDMEIIFLGSGGSLSVPAIKCLLDPRQSCRTCIHAGHVTGSFNKRRNTSIIVKLRDKRSGDPKTILVDCGKDFYAAATSVFPSVPGTLHIDALLLSHGHHDALGGFDDLREWIQCDLSPCSRMLNQGGLHIFASKDTLAELRRRFWYMFDARGRHNEQMIVEHEIAIDGAFDLFGHRLIPLPVRHGVDTAGHPYTSLGFMFGSACAYIGDNSTMPDSTLSMLREHRPAALVLDVSSELSTVPDDDIRMAHAGLPSAVEIAQKLSPTCRIYLTGISHAHTHADWIAACQALQASELLREPSMAYADHTFVHSALDACAAVRLPGRNLWIRPARDALRLSVMEGKEIADCDYP